MCKFKSKAETRYFLCVSSSDSRRRACDLGVICAGARSSRQIRPSGVVEHVRLDAHFHLLLQRERPIDAVQRGANLLQQSDQLLGLFVEGSQRRSDRSASLVTQHDDEPRSEILGRKLDAADLRRGGNIARNADHEQVAEPLVEQKFDGRA